MYREEHPEKVEKSMQSNIICSRCGTINRFRSQHCVHCQAPLHADQAGEPRQNNKPSITPIHPNRRKLLWGLLGGGAALLFGGLGVSKLAESITLAARIKDFPSADQWAPFGWSADLTSVAIIHPAEKESAGARVSIWDYGQQRITRVLTTGPLTQEIVWSPGNRYVLCQQAQEAEERYEIAVWDVQAQRKVYARSGDRSLYFQQAIWSPNALRVAFVSFASFEIWDVALMKPLLKQPVCTKEKPALTLRTLAWSQDGRYLALLVRRTQSAPEEGQDHWGVRVWDVARHEVVGEAFFDGKFTTAAAVAWSPTGQQIAAYTDNQLHILDTASSRAFSISKEIGSDCSFAWAPDGMHLAIAYKSNANIWKLDVWDTQQQRQLDSIYRGQMPLGIRKLAWTGDSSVILAVNEKNQLEQWAWI